MVVTEHLYPYVLQCRPALLLKLICLASQAKVILSTRSLSLCIEKVDQLGCSINAGCNVYDVSIAIVELSHKLRK